VKEGKKRTGEGKPNDHLSKVCGGGGRDQGRKRGEPQTGRRGGLNEGSSRLEDCCSQIKRGKERPEKNLDRWFFETSSAGIVNATKRGGRRSKKYVDRSNLKGRSGENLSEEGGKGEKRIKKASAPPLHQAINTTTEK